MLNGYRVLVVEDEAVVAEDLRATIEEAEGVVLGPFPTAGDARALLKSGSAIDAAVLDVNVSDGMITPVLEALCARGIPTVVCTGGEVPDDVRRRHPDLTVLAKPVRPARLIGELRRVSGGLSG
ncbi:MAG TPA: response regulator [Microvirga sp.]|jgi:DNA-binding NtrC family response regulator|nr:response regulator [Microvirga sp.]